MIRKPQRPRNLNFPFSFARPNVAALVLSCSCLLLLGTRAAQAFPQTQRFPPAPTAAQFAIADFDGDNQPDLATIGVGFSTPMRTHYWIAFQLSSGPRSALGITAPTGGLCISSRDVNGDDFPDVVITTAWTNRPVAVLLNDGFGNFTESDPRTFPSAFSSPESFLVGTAPEIRDAFASLLSRHDFSEYSAGTRIGSPDGRIDLLPQSIDLRVRQVCLASSLGRAPPSLKLLV